VKTVIKFTSVTYALKAKETLRNYNIKSTVAKNPKPEKGEGCGYVLTLDGTGAEAVRILESKKIPLKDVSTK